jgi:phosphoglycolate phosphatase
MSVTSTLIFDLDGTMVDTAPDLAGAMNALLQRFGRDPLPPGEVRDMVGEGARKLMARAWSATGKPASEAELDHLFDLFIAHYDDHLTDNSQPFDGLEQVLDLFLTQGFRLAVCTNKSERASRNLLQALDLDHRFAALIGGDTLAHAKPHPAPVHEALKRAGGSVERAVMIGDSKTDIHAARAAGLPVIAVSFGYSREPVATFKPDLLVDRLHDLPVAVARLLD